MSDIFARILVAVSGTASSEEAARMAVQLAMAHGATITLVYVVDMPMVAEFSRGMREPEEQVLSRMEASGRTYLHQAERMAHQKGVPVETSLRRGIPHSEIIEEARVRAADLIVIGSSTRAGSIRMGIGRVVARVVENAECPVLVVHPLADQRRLV